MKKDYHYYHKRTIIWNIIALVLFILGVLTMLFHTDIISMDASVYIVMGFGFSAFISYFISALYHNKRDDILRAEKQQRKKREFNEILTLIKEQKDKEAYDALCNYANKYN